MKSYLISLLAGLLFGASSAFLLTGCQTNANTGVHEFTPTGKLLARFGTSVAVGKVCENNPKHAARIAEIAGQIRVMSQDGMFSTVDAVMVEVDRRIRWENLTEGEASMVRDMLAALAAELKSRIGEQQLASAYLLTVSEIALWVEESARARIPSTNTP